MNKRFLKSMEKILRAERERLTADMTHIQENHLNRSHKEASGDLSGYSLHMADVGTDNFETELELSIAGNVSEKLSEIDAALKRVEDGTLGVCERCESTIGQARLKVMPSARHCITCKSILEKEGSF